MAKILVGFATRNGSTQEVAEALAAELRAQGLDVDLQPLRSVQDIGGFGGIIMGAPLYLGRWHKDALGFLSKFHQAVVQRPVAIFALGPFHNDAKELQEVRDQLDKELAKLPWLSPTAIAIFGGVLDPTHLHFPESLFMGKVPPSDARDWEAIRAWARDMAEKMKSADKPAST